MLAPKATREGTPQATREKIGFQAAKTMSSFKSVLEESAPPPSANKKQIFQGLGRSQSGVT